MENMENTETIADAVTETQSAPLDIIAEIQKLSAVAQASFDALSDKDRKIFWRVVGTNPTVQEVEDALPTHRTLDAILDELYLRRERFRLTTRNRFFEDNALFQADNRAMFEDNVENGVWNLDQLQIAEQEAIVAEGEATIGEAAADDESRSRDLRVLLTPSADGSVVMATHENVGKSDKTFYIKKALKCSTQKASELQLFWRKIGLSVKDGVSAVQNGMTWSGVRKQFRDVEHAWKYFNNLACELDAITPEDMREGTSDGFNAPTVAYHKMGEVVERQKVWKPRKRLQTLLDHMEACTYPEIKAFASKMVKHRFETWEEGSIFWSEYKRLRNAKNPAPYHTRLGEKALDRIRQRGGKVDIQKLKAFLFKHGGKGDGRLNEKDVNALWAFVRKVSPAAEPVATSV